MFGKLLKWDFNNNISILAIMLLSTGMSLATLLISKLNIGIITTLFTVISMLTIAGMLIYSFMRLPLSVAKDIYGNHGYRYNMIPVKTSKLWDSKIIIGFFFSLLAILVAVFNFAIISSSMPKLGMGVMEILKTMFNEPVNGLSEAFNLSHTVASVVFIAFIVSVILFKQFSLGFIIMFSNTKLFRNMGPSRYILGLLAYYICFQILAVIVLLFLPINLEITELAGKIHHEPIYKPFLSIAMDNPEGYFPLAGVGFAFILLISQYFVTKYQMNRHLNL